MRGTAKAVKEDIENKCDKRVVETYVCHKSHLFEVLLFSLNPRLVVKRD